MKRSFDLGGWPCFPSSKLRVARPFAFFAKAEAVQLPIRKRWGNLGGDLGTGGCEEINLSNSGTDGTDPNSN
jgi:hypothetical protein